MQKQIIAIPLRLHPESFEPLTFEEAVLAQVKTREMTCDPVYGYIDQVFRIIDLKNLKLEDDGMCRVEAHVECMVFKPVVGGIIEVKVVLISEHGIFSELGRNTNRFLVPIDRIESKFRYTADQTFVHKSITKDMTIRKDDLIRVRISNFRYSNRCFCCIADLVVDEE